MINDVTQHPLLKTDSQLLKLKKVTDRLEKDKRAKKMTNVDIVIDLHIFYN